MTPLLVATGVAVFAGAALQGATGFGFALLSAPLVFAALDAQEAIGLLLLLGMEIGVLTLATEGRRPRPMLRRCAVVLVWAVPAAVVGVAVLKALDAIALQVAVSVGVVATLLMRRRAPTEHRGREPRWAAPATGLSVIGVVALVVTRTEDALPGGGLVAVFVPLVLLAQIAGRPLFARLAERGAYEPVLNATLVIAVVAGLATAVL